MVAHELIVKEIYSKGYERITTKGEKTLGRLMVLAFVIDNPFHRTNGKYKAAFGRMFAERYADLGFYMELRQTLDYIMI